MVRRRLGRGFKGGGQDPDVVGMNLMFGDPRDLDDSLKLVRPGRQFIFEERPRWIFLGLLPG